MENGRVHGLLRRLLVTGICASIAAGYLPAASVHAEEVQADNAADVVADWKFSENGVKSGTIAGGDLVIADQSGNGNDLRMQLYTGKQPTEDPGAADWTEYLSFSDDSMTGSEGSMVFNGDSSNAGADFITVDGAEINSETFDNGYTMEFIYYFPTDWTTADSWMSLIARQGRADSVSEWQQGTMFTSISNCKEIQYVAANRDDSHMMSSAAWSVSMDKGGVWYHIAVTSDGHEISTYVNGCEAFRDYVSDEMTGLYADPEDGRFRIGSSWWNEGGQTLDKFLQGSLQEVRISSGCLDESQWLVEDPEQYLGEYGSNESYELRDEDNYNIVLIPDTQNTVEYCGDVMNAAVRGLIDTADELNVRGVIHLGDVVDDNNDDAQYVTARDVFYQLPDAGIKFLVQMGNHDGWSSGIHNYYNSFSGKSTSFLRRASWYLTNSPNGDGNSSYMFVQGGSYNYLVISLSCTGSGSGQNNNTSWDSRDEEWLRSVLEEYPNCPTIVTTHDLQNCSATEPSSIQLSSQGTRLWNIVKDYDQVFMMVGGHSHGSGMEMLENTNGKPVISILTDYQFAYNGGNGFFRYLEFDENADKIYYSTYSPYAAALPDEEKSFFDVNFMTGEGNEGEIDLEFSSRFPGMEIQDDTASDSGRYMEGEYHTHTGQSKDATSSYMSLDNVLGAAFRNESVLSSADPAAKLSALKDDGEFDFLGLADHLRASYNGTDGKGNGQYNTAFYVALQTQMREIEKLQVKGLYTDKLISSGFEWDMPGLDHASVGILDENGETVINGIHEFEWKYAGTGDDPDSLFTLDDKADDMDEQSVWGDRQGGSGDPQTAYDAAAWLQENYPDSYLLPNHPSRHNGGSGEVTIENLRRLNDAAPDVVFGFEGMPGNQMSGSGRAELPAGDIRNGADEMIAVTGGVWDSLLSEGRKIYNFANSDFHFKVSADEQYSSGYWASEYSANHVYVEPGEDGTYDYGDVVDGLRSGNSYSTYGSLISDLTFTAETDKGSATMGGELAAEKGDQVKVTVRFRVPEINNYESLYGTDTGIDVDNTPELDHVDLISGSVTGRVSEDQYGEISSDAKIVKTFTKEELEAAKGEDGYYTLTFTSDADQNCYFRLRGTTVSEVDENGDPLPDPDFSGISDNITRFDTINDYNYSSLCFYANPIWVNVSEKTVTLDTQVLERALELAAEADTEGVIPSVAERFGQIYASAQSVLERAQAGDPEITQAMVDQSWHDLINIMQYLSFKQGNKTNLEKVIEVADGIDLDKYLSTGKDEFTAALEAARTVMDDADAMQAEVDTAWENLLKAIADLRLKPSKELLEALIQTAEGMSLENVETGVADTFTAALAQAKSVYADSDAGEKEVSAAVENLQNAIAAVEENLAGNSGGQGETTDDPDSQGGQNSGNGGNSGNDQNSENVQTNGNSQNIIAGQNGAAGQNTSGNQNSAGKKAVKTGDTDSILLWAVMLGMSGAAAVLLKKKREMQ